MILWAPQTKATECSIGFLHLGLPKTILGINATCLTYRGKALGKLFFCYIIQGTRLILEAYLY